MFPLIFIASMISLSPRFNVVRILISLKALLNFPKGE